MWSKSYVKFDESKGEKVYVPCAECRRNTNHEVASSADETLELDNGSIKYWTSHQIVRCLGCRTFSFREVRSNSEEFYEDEGTTWLDEAVEVYPPRAVGRQRLRDDFLLPKEIDAIYHETYTAICSDLPVLAVVGIRSLVEAICKEKGAKGNNLEDKINSLVNLGVLTNSGAEILQKLRLLGNQAAHEIKHHNKDTVNLAFDVVEHTLNTVYLIPAKADRLK